MKIEALRSEVWVPIQEFPNYQVSNLGRVKSPKGIIMKPWLESNNKGCTRYRVQLYKDSKRYNRVLKNIVWEAFKGEIPNGYVVQTYNNSQTMCELENLYLVNETEFGIYNAKKRCKRIIDERTGKVYNGLRDCESKVDVSYNTIIRILKGAYHPKYRFRYLQGRPKK